MHILFTRPLEDCHEMILKFQSLGHEISHLPLINIEGLKHEAPNYSEFKGIIFTSTNAIKFLDIKRIDKKLHDHLINENITFMQFAFRWMNCLLMRELELNCIVRLWDTYLSETNRGFDDFHVYVCASFLTSVWAQLKTLEFQDLVCGLCYCFYYICVVLDVLIKTVFLLFYYIMFIFYFCFRSCSFNHHRQQTGNCVMLVNWFPWHLYTKVSTLGRNGRGQKRVEKLKS
jgi:hypothetical protein